MITHSPDGRMPGGYRGDVRQYGGIPRVSEPLPVTGGSRLALPLPRGIRT